MSDNTELCDSLREFCAVELKITALCEAYKAAVAPLRGARIRAHDVLMSVMADDDKEWVRLADNQYLRRYTSRVQCSIKRDLVDDSFKAVIDALHDNGGTDVDISRDTILDRLRTELRKRRDMPVVNLLITKTLPRNTELGTIDPASAFIEEMVSEWVNAKAALATRYTEHLAALQLLKKQKSDILERNSVNTYMAGLSSSGQDIRLENGTKKMRLNRAISTRRNPIRERHVQDGLCAIADKFVESFTHSTSHDSLALAALFMGKVFELAGSTTTSTFSLTMPRGRKRAAETF